MSSSISKACWSLEELELSLAGFWQEDRLDVLDHQTVIYPCLFRSLLKGVPQIYQFSVTRSILLTKGALRQCATSKIMFELLGTFATTTLGISRCFSLDILALLSLSGSKANNWSSLDDSADSLTPDMLTTRRNKL